LLPVSHSVNGFDAVGQVTGMHQAFKKPAAETLKGFFMGT